MTDPDAATGPKAGAPGRSPRRWALPARPRRGSLRVPGYVALLGFVAAVAAIAEMYGSFGPVTWTGPLPVPVTTAAVPVLAFAGVWARPVHRRWVLVYLSVAVALAVAAALLAAGGEPSSIVAGLLCAAAVEEAIFRAALPAALYVTARALHLPGRVAFWAAWGLAVTSFVVMPGHLAQAPGALGFVVLAGVAAAFAWLVCRHGAFLAAVGVHAAYNAWTFVLLEGLTSPGLRLVAMAAITVAVVCAVRDDLVAWLQAPERVTLGPPRRSPTPLPGDPTPTRYWVRGPVSPEPAD